MELKVFVGNDIPLSLKALTLSNGLMQYWLMDRKNVVAVVAYENGVHVGWCAYNVIDENIVEVGTFVLSEYRQCNLATRLLNATMYALSSAIPNAQVRYGSSIHLEYNDTMMRTIKNHGLEAVRWY